MKTKLLIVAALISGHAMAANQVQKWEGSGTAYTPTGQALGTYQVSVINTEVAPQVIQSETTITLADGSQKQISQKLSMNGSKWGVNSNLGQGGGACYGMDLCENYIADAKGAAYSTTIVMDGAKARRQITVELQDGKAVKVLREQIVQVQ